ncbi:MAG TPA: class I tRNA ligase family protein [Bacteroidia bacterium]|nr:class I tRNA ligase family protein [Bacteroidia bacterium]
MEYNFRETEQKWQKYWAEKKTFRAENNSSKPKYYVLDMFPYPSGAGLHVGHPLGYIASDIVARFKRLKGFNVLHPMGYDSFGLPAEQYAIQTGQHPAITTENNIARYREQLDKIGFSFDWEREVRTSDPKYYKWTQWIFIKLFHSWYNPETDKAESIEKLIEKFESGVFSLPNGEGRGGAWSSLSEKEKSDVLMEYRLAYLSEAMVNWCAALGTVLANEEVKDGVSERGGYPVERKLMPQWSLRITAYAERLLNDLEKIDWSESLKESQRNWIGKSEGSSLKFHLSPNPSPLERGTATSQSGLHDGNALSFGEGGGEVIEVFTTRPDTVFGVTFMTLSPEHELIEKITTPENKKAVEEYVTAAKNRSERERMAEVKNVSGVFTGAYVIHPFSGKQIPIWIGDYVLAGYGTGAVMGVPAHDSRDFAFAKHFNLEIIKVIEPNSPSLLEKGQRDEVFCFDTYEGTCINSDFINGMQVKDAIKKIISEIEKRGLGKGKTNYRLRDANFGRQRYWGEPIPIYYKDGIPHTIPESELPLVLPEVDKYLPTESGEPPLARAKNWTYTPHPQPLSKGEGSFPLETTTMPGWAGSSWYYLRYMDAHNEKEFASREAINYWKDVDLYIGGSEHATGHLLYVRFWTKFLNDLRYIPITEPAKKLINQGMIQGVSEKIKRLIFNKDALESKSNSLTLPSGKIIGFNETKIIYVSADTNLPDFEEDEWYSESNVNIVFVKNSVLNIPEYLESRKEDYDSVFVCKSGYWLNGIFHSEDGKSSVDFLTKPEVEKMSKSKLNVVTPDYDPVTKKNGIIDDYGADCLRLYEMFLGPLEQSKPWNTNGISGVSNFIRKLWRLYHSNASASLPPGEGQGGAFFFVSNEPATKAELKTLHKTIKKVTDDIERYSFNTSVSNFMICVNELTDLKCYKREILEPLAILISPYAPHIAEELWEKLGHQESITFAQFPVFKEEYLVEDSFDYPVSINGKTRFKIPLSLQLTKEQIEKEVLSADELKKYLDGNAPKKIIVVPGRIVNVVI